MKLLIIFGIFVIFCDAVPKYKICSYPTSYGKCNSLSRGDSQVECVKVTDSVDCAVKIQNGQADFGAFFPEQALLAANFINDETRVVGEIRQHEAETKNNSFQTVVVVRKDYSGNIDGLRGKKYCHPGFQYDTLWSPRVRKELENFLFRQQNVDICKSDKKTLVETEIENLSKFFGDSCRPGEWTNDDELDKDLKKKFSNLCKLCENPSTCSYDGNEPNLSALKCLTERNGDIAYTSLDAVTRHNFDKENYRFLCRNFETKDITRDITNECAWRNQPWSLILSKREKVFGLQKDLKLWIDPAFLAIPEGATPFTDLQRAGIKDWVTSLREILSPETESRFYIFTDEKNVISHLNKNDQAVKLDKTNCDMKWCAISDLEYDKCKWLSQAAQNAGVKPEITCIPGNNVFDCLNKIKKQEADVMSIDSNYGYLARKKNIGNLLYTEAASKDVSSVVALLPANSEIKSFSDMKDKKVCFPEYRGIAWLSFVDTAQSLKAIKKSCDYGKIVGEYFSEACAPGAQDAANHHKTNGTNAEKLCALCLDRTGAGKNCAADEDNKYFDNNGALKCLEDQVADVVFLEKQALDNNPKMVQYDVLCKDETKKSLDQADENCVLANIVNSEVVCRRDDERKDNYKLALLQMEKIFGNADRVDKTMLMFGKFKDTSDVLFKSTVLGFDDESSKNTYVQNYIDLFEHVDKCTGGSIKFDVSGFMILTSLLAVYFTKNM